MKEEIVFEQIIKEVCELHVELGMNEMEFIDVFFKTSALIKPVLRKLSNLEMIEKSTLSNTSFIISEYIVKQFDNILKNKMDLKIKEKISKNFMIKLMGIINKILNEHYVTVEFDEQEKTEVSQNNEVNQTELLIEDLSKYYESQLNAENFSFRK